MNKKKRILSIALIAIATLLIAFIVWHWVAYGKDETIALFGRVKDFINQPLPIIGVSLIVLGGIALKFVSMSAYGKKQIEAVKRELNEGNDNLSKRSLDLDRRLDAFATDESRRNEFYNGEIESLKEDIEAIRGYFASLPNKKAEKLVEELTHDEREDA